MQHLDLDEWRTKLHRTHLCVDGPMGKGCGHTWKPSVFNTVGVTAAELEGQPIPPVPSGEGEEKNTLAGFLDIVEEEQRQSEKNRGK